MSFIYARHGNVFFYIKEGGNVCVAGGERVADGVRVEVDDE